jgi:ribonuclease E
LTLRSNAPALVYEEGSLIKRAIRDLYNKDISEIVVDGDDAYRDAKDFMRMIMPSHAKNVKQYREALPLFQRFRVESQLDAMFSPIVHLRSGGYIVINQTEALVSIDVNSGKATREHSIEETATKTNLEASDEIARQLRLRDLAGLIVIDFIDMEDSKNDRNVEKRLHNAVKNDRARIQIGKISQFGLLEMSRQRLRSGVIAGSTITCPHCAGIGLIRSTESAALRLLRALDEEGQRAPAANVRVRAPEDVTIYTLNQKRREISRIEEAYDLAITFDPQATMVGGTFELERTGARTPSLRPKTAVSVEAGFVSSAPEEPETDVTIIEAPAEAEPQHAEHERESVDAAESTEQPNAEGRRRRRRRRRGGRGRGPYGEPAGTVSDVSTQPSAAHQSEAGGSAEFESEPDEAAGEEAAVESLGPQSQTGVPGPQQKGSQGEGGGRRRRRRRGRRGRRHEGDMSVQISGPANTQAPQNDTAAAVGIAPFTPEPLEDTRESFTPNAPSQPQWSLSEREHRSEPANPIADLNVRAAPPPIARTEAVPDVAASSEQPASSEEAPASTAHEDELDANREPRKGWWQRRFKL